LKLTFKVDDLKKRLSQLKAVVRPEPGQPVSGDIHFQAVGGKVKLTGNDVGQASLEVQIPAIADQDGVFLLPAAQLEDLLAYAGSPDISIELKEDVAVLRSGKYRGKLRTDPIDQFRVPVSLNSASEIFVLGLPALLGQLERVLFTVPDGGVRTDISVAKLESNGESVRLVGTDGYRLAISDVAQKAGGEFGYAVPKTALNLVRGLTGGRLTIRQDEATNTFAFETETETLIVQRTSGKFPPYDKILPTVFKTEFAIAGEELMNLSGRARALSVKGEKGERKITFDVNPESGTLIVSQYSVTPGEEELSKKLIDEFGDNKAVEETQIKAKGEAVKFNLDAELLLPFLEIAAKTPDVPVSVFINGETNVVDFQSGAYRYLLMPMK
jgi:DNA polymerase-3 subunit beta